MMPQHSIEMLADWIIKHRNDKVFVGDTKEQIALGIQEDIKYGNILYAFDDETCDFTGVISFRSDATNKLVFVRNLLITKHSSLQCFIKYFHMHYAGFTITASRNNEYIQYNTFRLVNLLHNMKQSNLQKGER